jgi:sigma-B regulation protein RsbU (phosphoserine phosphatase)
MVMADVSGKGVPASLFMAITKTLIKTHTFIEDSPEKIFSYVNKVICDNNQDDMFVTAWLGILDLKTGLVKAVNAGHEYPAIMLPEKGFSLFQDKHTLPIGSMDGISFEQYEFLLPPGSKLYLYTDGVTEATNKDEKLFGTDRMMEALNKVSDKDPAEILSFMKKSINDYVGDAPQFDDFTMLCLRYNGQAAREGGQS